MQFKRDYLVTVPTVLCKSQNQLFKNFDSPQLLKFVINSNIVAKFKSPNVECKDQFRFIYYLHLQ